MLRRSTFLPLAAALSIVALVLGGCSSDDDSSTRGANSGSQAADASGSNSGGEDSDERAFDVEREDLARALSIGASADDYEVDGDTIRLIFNDGSKDSVTAMINCTASNQLKADDDRVQLVFPDGAVDCDAL